MNFACPYQKTVDIDPTFALLPTSGIRHITSNNPLLKVIVLIRDPVDRAYSNILMNYGPNINFEVIKSIVDNYPYESSYIYSDYPTWLGRWMSFLPEGRFLFVPFSLIGSDPLRVLEDVCRFIGVPFDTAFFPLASKVKNKGDPRGPKLDDKAQDLLASAMEPIYKRYHLLPLAFSAASNNTLRPSHANP